MSEQRADAARDEVRDADRMDYRSAGVDIDAAEDSKDRLSALVASTRTAGMRGAFGGFGGMFRVPAGYEQPLLVSSADGVGTKIKVAIESGRHDTIGHCLVNHCTNDILVQGARPLFFLDYVAFGKLLPHVVEQVVAGVAAGCRENGCALVGGETAEMPGLYTPPDYDLAGFIVGIVEERAVLGAHNVRDGDVLIGLASSGLHTNGYSLARRIVAERLHLSAHDAFPDADGKTVADVLLATHRSYLACLWPLLSAGSNVRTDMADGVHHRGAAPMIHAMAHITGGGLPGNLNRILPSTLDAIVDTQSWTMPSVFRVLEDAGAVTRMEMFRAFNMGVGMVVVVAKQQADTVMNHCTAAGVDAWLLGHVAPGTGTVQLQGVRA